ncbi:MAG: cytochrome C552 [Thermodesulfobacteriota bacterium]|nr:cytochrome C552 [Thermodesulfobacteriota bacterium]
MRKVGLGLLIVFLLGSVGMGGEKEKSVFHELRCDVCHKADSSGNTPSLKDIAQGYQGKEAFLMGYLKGGMDPLLKPGGAGVMKRYLQKTKALSDMEGESLANFIMSQLK